jgi:hypothetical protein
MDNEIDYLFCHAGFKINFACSGDQGLCSADIFSPNYKLTIGVDFSLKTLEWSSGLKINLQLW